LDLHKEGLVCHSQLQAKQSCIGTSKKQQQRQQQQTTQIGGKEKIKYKTQCRRTSAACGVLPHPKIKNHDEIIK
jgi:hypothetical protein